MAREKVNAGNTREEAVAAFIGVDWADQKHGVCLMAAGSGRREHEVIEHTPQALADWILRLRKRFGGRKIALCLEQSRGPLFYALMNYEFLLLYPATLSPPTSHLSTKTQHYYDYLFFPFKTLFSHYTMTPCIAIEISREDWIHVRAFSTPY